MRRWSIAVFVASLMTIALIAPSAYGATAPVEEERPAHPSFPLLDGDGVNVLESSGPVSPLQTCGQCHDSAFIERHDMHAAQGLHTMTAPGETASGRPWDVGEGTFGRWNPITYRYLTPLEDTTLDLGTADWIRVLGARHVGGGPAERSQGGTPLEELVPGDPGRETHVLGDSGSTQPWDWTVSGTVELNCFLCHIDTADNDARVAALQTGNFRWADTATLGGSSVVSQSLDGSWSWNPAAFDSYGRVLRDFVQVQDPSDTNCGQCHGVVYEQEQPLSIGALHVGDWQTLTTGQVFSSQLISASGMNIAGKQDLSRPWDLHAGLVDCVDCHHAVNNPVLEGSDFPAFGVTERDRDLYLLRPSHLLANATDSEAGGGCESCHDVTSSHEWLPDPERHLEELACETCHIPASYQPAAEAYDWTVVHVDGSPRMTWRGLRGSKEDSTVVTAGYAPVILRSDAKLAPFNLVASWFWVQGDPQRPVRQSDLLAAFTDNGTYRPEIVSAFDSDGDGVVADSELAIDDDAKLVAVQARLEALGLTDVHIEAEIQPYPLSHGVATHDWAIKDCTTCHSSESPLTAPIQLAKYVPGGVLPEFVADAGTEMGGALTFAEDGSAWYHPEAARNGVTTLAQDSKGWLDWAGWALVLLVVAGIGLHSLMRWGLSVELRRARPELRAAESNTGGAGAWHATQLVVLAVLAVTGVLLRGRGPNGGLLTAVHNIGAGVLLLAALWAVVWHLSGTRGRRLLPRPRGIFDQALEQVLFFGQRFLGRKRAVSERGRAGRVLSVFTLGIVLPFELITGAMIWAAQIWPHLTASLGGFPILIPLHAAGAWLLVAGLLAHLYGAATRHRPIAVLRQALAEPGVTLGRESS